ncbi:cyclic nucleotide-binding domain-containing protein [Sphingosinicella rhizophila]|uniref:Cyclic nucleotide-binding domain-containing protein n=1 Tax=Sphingosinicella rhizophila TaxID=3050082 RepID=A0ABU3Q5D7_9SPHN|nr:cyclic nucleotide-binding domain-containing protein [Sphingosinicella sp. GR2756]MDT9598183.1 cyclic nucleotide-binding domain-containing protein [Sphingosinicella sp. GR2756]
MASSPSVRETRRAQIYPSLEGVEIDRLRRFASHRRFGAGEMLVRGGEPGHGLAIILNGQVEVYRHGGGTAAQLITTHGSGNFVGELAQLSGRPALFDARAREMVEALIIAPDQLRALLTAEAELGERIMRALILRRVGLIESGDGGPVIIGRAGDGDVLRLEGFLSRNGHPFQRLDAESDSCAQALVD